MGPDEIVFPALANVFGRLLGLFYGAAHAARGVQELQEIIGSLIPLVHSDIVGGRGRGGRSLCDLLYAPIVARTELAVHV